MDFFVHSHNLPDYKGEAWHVEDMVSGQYYVVSRANSSDRGDETMIFAADGAGNVTDWTDLYAGYGVDHETAIQEFSTFR